MKVFSVDTHYYKILIFTIGDAERKLKELFSENAAAKRMHEQYAIFPMWRC